MAFNQMAKATFSLELAATLDGLRMIKERLVHVALIAQIEIRWGFRAIFLMGGLCVGTV